MLGAKLRAAVAFEMHRGDGDRAVGEVRIGLLGLGTVGAGVVKILQAQRATLEQRAGCRLRLAAVADTDLTRPREGLDLQTLPPTNDAARKITVRDGAPSLATNIVARKRAEDLLGLSLAMCAPPTCVCG